MNSVCCGIRWLQDHVTGSYPEQDTSIPHPPFVFFKMHFNISCHLHLDLPCVLFPSGFQSGTLYTIFCSLVRTIFSADLILLELIIVITFGDQYKSVELFIMHFSPADFYFPVVVSRYLPEHLVLQQLQSVFFRQYERPRFRFPVTRRKTIC